MAFEVHDDRIPFSKQYVSIAIILINIIVFIWQLTDPSANLHLAEAAFYPRDLFTGQKLWTIITAMFMHGDFLHIFMNMLFFVVVADNVENKLGHLMFLVAYILSGVSAALLHAVVALLSPGGIFLDIPTLGASGAIFGVIAMYGILFPNNQVYFLMTRRVVMKAKQFIIVYFIIQLIYGIATWGYSSTAYFAHIGGFITGATIALIYKYVG